MDRTIVVFIELRGWYAGVRVPNHHSHSLTLYYLHNRRLQGMPYCNSISKDDTCNTMSVLSCLVLSIL